MIAGQNRTELVAPWVLEGAMDGGAFKTYTADILAKQKAQLLYLPPYSPDMSLVKMAF